MTTLHKPHVLCVDDEPNILSGFVRHLRKDFHLSVAENGMEALQILREEDNIAVICSDFNMPGMMGVEFLREAAQLRPDATRMLLTGRNDLSIAVDGVNEGRIFRFLMKPCSPEQLLTAFQDAARQYQLVTSEKELLEQTLAGSVKLLMELLTHVNPTALSRGNRIRRLVQNMLLKLRPADAWRFETAAALSQIGCLALPPDLRDKVNSSRPLMPVEQERVREHPRLAAGLLSNIPRLQEIAEMIAQQAEPFEFTPATANIQALSPTVLGGMLIKVAVAYDDQLQQGRTPEQAISALRARSKELHPILVSLLDTATAKSVSGVEMLSVTVAELRPRMVIDQDVRAANGVLVVSRGQEATPDVIARLQQLASRIGIQEPFDVLVQRTPATTHAP